MNKSRCFLLVSGDFVRTGGMDMGNYFLADYLSGLSDAEVHIVSHRVEKSLTSRVNVIFHQVQRPANSNLIGGQMLRYAGRHIARQLLDSGLSPQMLVNGGNCLLPDVNWVHYVHAAYTPQMSGGFFRRVKANLIHRLYLAQEKQALRKAKTIIANSERTKADLIRHYGIAETRIHTVYYGTDPLRFYPCQVSEKDALRASLGLPTDQFLMVFIGALGDRRKGFDTLFAAWTSLPATMRKAAQLIVIGRGAELEMWEARTAKAGLKDSITFLGFREDVPEILRASDALIAPTRYEAFGLGVLEALCCGLPALVSRRAGVAELYSAELGDLLLDDPENISELNAKLQLLISRGNEWTGLMQCVAAHLRTNTWKTMAENIYKRISL